MSEQSVNGAAGHAADGAGEGTAFVPYGAFGEQFFRRAVTAERVLGAVNVLAGQPIEFGPTGVGPGRLVRLTATGSIGSASSEHVPGEWIAYRVTLPVKLAFEVDLSVEVHRFTAGLVVPLVLSARALEDVKVFIDVTPPRARDIVIDLQARGLRASVLQRVAGVEGEVRRFVAKYVTRELEKPHIRAARTIDVGAAIDQAWERLGPSSPQETVRELSDDLEEALEHEEFVDPATAGGPEQTG